MIDIELWAIKNGDRNGLVGSKTGRTLWKRKPTQAAEAIAWRANRYGVKVNPIPIKVRIKEIEQ